MRIQPRDIEVPEDDPFKHDLPDRREAVDTLTHLVGTIEGPCVLAVDAAWGAGKTTFLRIWAQNLRNEKFPVVSFNAWETDFSEEPFVSLSTELTEGLHTIAGEPLGTKIDAIREAAKDFLRRAAPGTIQLAAATLPIVGVELGKVFSAYAEESLSQHREARKTVREFKDALQAAADALSEGRDGRPLILMIDELDRCRPSYAVELLEVAKHLFSVDRIVFVLAVNRDQLAHSVRALSGSNFDAEGYLRRFFDVDCRLPDPDRAAFIDKMFTAMQIERHFARTKNPNVLNEVRALLWTFLGTSDHSVRTIPQTLHRLRLVLASLRKDRVLLAVTTTVALILRTIDSDLYHRFISREASDLDVVNAVFGRPDLKALQYGMRGALFETTIVLAALEDEIPNMSSLADSTLFSPGPIRTPLLDWYLYRQQTDREIKDKGGDPEIEKRISEGKHAKRVFNKVKQEIQNGRGQIGFGQAVQRLELLSATLIDEQPKPPTANS